MGDDAHILRGRLSSVKAIAPQLESLVSTDGVIPFSEASPVWQSQIQQATQPESLPQCIVYPRTSVRTERSDATRPPGKLARSSLRTRE
uniref:Uncharacterized protein n=1 Tax=Desertifilum tharense IPPAS B-1220 TaxID=1781255 RepID=A0ACD5GU60_9CYAN